MPCSNAAKTRNPLKFVRVPQTRQRISAARGPMFTILRGHVEEILLLNNFFPIVHTCLRFEDIARQSHGMVPWLFGDFLLAVFSASRAQHVSDLHYKFTLRPHHAWTYGRHLQPLRLGEEKKEEETTGWKYIWPALLHRAAIKEEQITAWK